jgi:hypothetical protein
VELEIEQKTARSQRGWTAKAALLRSATIALFPDSDVAQRWAESWPGPLEVSPLLVASFLEDPTPLERMGQHRLRIVLGLSETTPRSMGRERLGILKARLQTR